jgi:hypothetical protein
LSVLLHAFFANHTYARGAVGAKDEAENFGHEAVEFFALVKGLYLAIGAGGVAMLHVAGTHRTP